MVQAQATWSCTGRGVDVELLLLFSGCCVVVLFFVCLFVLKSGETCNLGPGRPK